MPAGLQVRAPGNRRGAVRLCTASNRLAYGRMSCQPCRRTKDTGANAEGTTAHIGRSRGVQAPTLQAANGVAGGPMVSYPLSPRPNAEDPLEGSSVGRAAGFGPVGRGFESFPSSQISRPATVGSTKPPANAVRHYRLSPSWSRVRVPPFPQKGRVAQLDRARRVAKPLSPGPQM